LVIGLNDEEEDEKIKTLLTELLTIVTDIFKDERFLSHAYIVRGYMIDLQEIQELKNKSPLKELLEAAKTDTNHEFPSAGLHSPVQKFSRYRLLLETVKKSFEGTGIEVTMLDDAIKHMNNATMIQNSVTEEGSAKPYSVTEEGSAKPYSVTEEGSAKPSSEPMSEDEDEDEYEVFDEDEDEDEDEDGYGVVDVGTLAMGLTSTEVDEVLSSIGIQGPTLTPEIKVKLRELILSQRQKKRRRMDKKVKEQLEGLEKPVLEKQVASASGVIQQMREILEETRTGSQSPSQSSSKTGKELWKKAKTMLHVTTAFGEKHEEVMDEAEGKLASLRELNETRREAITLRGTPVYSRIPEGPLPRELSPVGSSPSPPVELSPVELSQEKEDKIERLKLNGYFEEIKTKCEQISDTVELHAELSNISLAMPVRDDSSPLSSEDEWDEEWEEAEHAVDDESSIEKLRKKLIEELKKKLGIKSKALHRRVAPPSSGTAPIEEIHASPDKIDKYLNMLIKQQQKIKKFLESIPRVFAVRDKVFVIDGTDQIPYSQDLTVNGIHAIQHASVSITGRVWVPSDKRMEYKLPFQSIIPVSRRLQWLDLKNDELKCLKHIFEGTWRETHAVTSFEIILGCDVLSPLTVYSGNCSAVFYIYSGGVMIAESEYSSDGYLKITQSENTSVLPLNCVGVFNHLGLYWSDEFKFSHWIKTGGLPKDRRDDLLFSYLRGGNNKRSKRTKRSKRLRTKRSRVKRSKRIKRSKRSKRLRTKRSRVKRTNRRRNTRRR
jgi:hypothetical protein